jgi:hypothetical protein
MTVVPLLVAAFLIVLGGGEPGWKRTGAMVAVFALGALSGALAVLN